MKSLLNHAEWIPIYKMPVGTIFDLDNGTIDWIVVRKTTEVTYVTSYLKNATLYSGVYINPHRRGKIKGFDNDIATR